VTDSSTGGIPGSKFWLFAASLAIAAAFVLSLCFVFEAKWETNDDVAMSMVAHGYGVAAFGSPNIIFSNVLWGCLVRSIPQIDGVLGYSIVTLGVLIIVGTILLFGLYRLGAGYAASLSVLALLLVRPVLFPQFTINAGLLLVAAIICFHLFARHNNLQALLIGCVLAFSSFLVRSNEFFLVLFGALPLLPWRTLLRSRSSQVAILSLIIVIAVSAAIDHKAYQGQQWKAFNELNPVRTPFTDFGADEHLKNRPDILGRYGFSTNDIDLIREWFFADPEIVNPPTLRVMLAELGPLPAQGNSIYKGWDGVLTLWDPKLLPLVLAAMLLALLRPSWQVAASWGLCVAAIFVIGVSGRPGIIRVYVPLVCLLTIAPFLVGRFSGFSWQVAASWGLCIASILAIGRSVPPGIMATYAPLACLLIITPFLVWQFSKWRNRLGVGLLLAAVALNSSLVFDESRAFQIVSEQAREGLDAFPRDPIVIWGIGFPLESVYPVMGASPAAMSCHFYGLGAFTLAPFSVAFTEQQQGRGMIDLLVQEAGVPIVAQEKCLRYLETYCRERLHGEIKELSAQQLGAIVVSRRRCEVAP
jgi:hypothetical protein